jgi:hypothetical protein
MPSAVGQYFQDAATLVLQTRYLGVLFLRLPVCGRLQYETGAYSFDTMNRKL